MINYYDFINIIKEISYHLEKIANNKIEIWSNIIIGILGLVLASWLICIYRRQNKMINIQNKIIEKQNIFNEQQKEDSKNILFSNLINEYSTKDMYEAIRRITDLSNSCYDKIDFNNLKKEHIKLWIDKFNSLTNDEREKYKYYEANEDRRIIANYFVKINILLEKELISKDLVERYWSEKALSFLAKNIITLQYIALQKDNQEKLERMELKELYKDKLNYYLPEHFYKKDFYYK